MVTQQAFPPAIGLNNSQIKMFSQNGTAIFEVPLDSAFALSGTGDVTNLKDAFVTSPEKTILMFGHNGKTQMLRLISDKVPVTVKGQSDLILRPSDQWHELSPSAVILVGGIQLMIRPQDLELDVKPNFDYHCGPKKTLYLIHGGNTPQQRTIPISLINGVAAMHGMDMDTGLTSTLLLQSYGGAIAFVWNEESGGVSAIRMTEGTDVKVNSLLTNGAELRLEGIEGPLQFFYNSVFVPTPPTFSTSVPDTFANLEIGLKTIFQNSRSLLNSRRVNIPLKGSPCGPTEEGSVRRLYVDKTCELLEGYRLTIITEENTGRFGLGFSSLPEVTMAFRPDGTIECSRCNSSNTIVQTVTLNNRELLAGSTVYTNYGATLEMTSIPIDTLVGSIIERAAITLGNP